MPPEHGFHSIVLPCAWLSSAVRLRGLLGSFVVLLLVPSLFRSVLVCFPTVEASLRDSQGCTQCGTVDGDAWVGQLRWVGSVTASENVVWMEGSEVQGYLQLHTGNGWGSSEQL